jgi:hypothetical protein
MPWYRGLNTPGIRGFAFNPRSVDSKRAYTGSERRRHYAKGESYLADESLSFSDMRTNSASDEACILCIACPR